MVAASMPQTIAQLSKTIRERAEKRDEYLNRVAQGTGAAAARAKTMLENDEKLLKAQGRLTGRSPEKVKDMQVQSAAIEEQKGIMSAQKAELEKLGLKAEDQASYRKEEIKLAEAELVQAKLSGSKEAEDAAKKKLAELKQNTFLGKIAGSLGGILKSGRDKIKSGLDGFKKFAFGALAVAAIMFLNNPKFKEIMDTIIDVIVPALAYLYDNVIKPLALYIGGKLNDLFEDLKSYVDGDKGIGSVITENIGILSAIVLALAPGLITTPLLMAVKLFGGAMKKSYLAQVATNALAGAGGKAGLLGTMKALGSTMLKFAGIGVLIYAAIVGIFQGAKDAFAEFDKTGSVWEAIKTFLVSFLANFAGAILNPIKDGISWVVGKIGDIFGIESFKNAESFLDGIDIVEGIKELLTFIGNFVSDFFKKSIDKIKNVGSNILSGVKNLVGIDEDEPLLLSKTGAKGRRRKKGGTVIPTKDENVVDIVALKEQQKLEKEIEEAKKLKQMKEQQVQASSALVDPRALAGPMPSQAAPIVVNAPATTNVNAPKTTNMTSGATSMINTDRVSDKLSFVG